MAVGCGRYIGAEFLGEVDKVCQPLEKEDSRIKSLII